jgi:hypothetical protein
MSCLTSHRYLSLIESYQTFSSDQGVTGTPTLLVRYGNSPEWQRVENRTYDNLKAMTQGANSQTN